MTENIYLGKDILIKDGDIQFSLNQDFSIVEYEYNLTQSIVNRLLTKKGEYYNIYYGSDLYRIKGQSASNLIITEATGYVFETLLQEPRIKTIDDITIELSDDGKSINISITITPINSNSQINIMYPYYIFA